MPNIQDKGWDAKDWIFKLVQGIALTLGLSFYYGTLETNKEILKALNDLKIDNSVQKQFNEFMKKNVDKLETRIERLEESHQRDKENDNR